VSSKRAKRAGSCGHHLVRTNDRRHLVGRYLYSAATRLASDD
jgi:hypothetical protein